MKLKKHIIFSIFVAIILYFMTNSYMVFFMTFLGGIILDIDHVIDYYLQEGFTLNTNEILDWFKKRRFKSIHIYFHSMELIFLLWLAIFLFNLNLIWIAFAIGIIQHMLLDILFSDIRDYAYLLSYRIIKGFKVSSIKEK